MGKECRIAKDLADRIGIGMLPEIEEFVPVVQHIDRDRCGICRGVALRAGWWPAGCKRPLIGLRVMAEIHDVVNDRASHDLLDHIKNCVGCSHQVDEFASFIEMVNESRETQAEVPVCSDTVMMISIKRKWKGLPFQFIPPEVKDHLKECKACQKIMFDL